MAFHRSACLTICMIPCGNRFVFSGNMVLPAGDPPTFGIVTYMRTTDGAVQQKPKRMNV